MAESRSDCRRGRGCGGRRRRRFRDRQGSFAGRLARSSSVQPRLREQAGSLGAQIAARPARSALRSRMFETIEKESKGGSGAVAEQPPQSGQPHRLHRSRGAELTIGDPPTRRASFRSSRRRSPRAVTQPQKGAMGDSTDAVGTPGTGYWRRSSTSAVGGAEFFKRVFPATGRRLRRLASSSFRRTATDR